MTSELRRLGLSDSVGVDKTVGRCLIAPVLRLDLCDEQASELLLQVLDNPHCVYVHVSPPIPGRQHRSPEHPDGCPDLDQTVASFEASRNSLYELCGRLFCTCWSKGILFSCENPGHSLLWRMSHWCKHTLCLHSIETMFHMCMWGSLSPRLTRIVHSVPALMQLGVRCCGVGPGHKHEALGKLHDSTYPLDLSRAWAHAIVDQLLELGATPRAQALPASNNPLHRDAQVAADSQPTRKKIPPLVSEFRCVITVDTSAPFLPGEMKKIDKPVPIPPAARTNSDVQILPPGSRILRRQLLGVSEPASTAAKHPTFCEPDVPSCSEVSCKPNLSSNPRDLVPGESDSHPAEAFAEKCLAQPHIEPEDILEFTKLLDSEKPARGTESQDEFSFTVGAFVHGGSYGLRKLSVQFPSTTKVLSAFIRQRCPDAVFTSTALLKNIQTKMHIDPNNSLPYLNTVVKISSFKGGDLWVCADQGAEPCPDEDFRHLKGVKVPFEGSVIQFDSHLKHCTYPWTNGPRVVLVGFVVKGPELIPDSLTEDLLSLGFMLPPEVANQPARISPPAEPEASAWHRVVVGIPWTPDEFISQALAAKHPKHLFTGLPSELRTTIDALATESPSQVGATRTEQLRKWVGRVQDLVPVEKAIKQRMDSNCARVLQSKRLAVFKELLEASHHKDETIVADIAEGFKLSGPIPASGVYRAKRTSATLTTAALRKAAHVLRRGILHSTKSSGDAELDQATIEATRDELRRGWLFGPVEEKDLPEGAVVTRRFGIRQGGKCRPIDNYLESGVNATTSASDTITVHSADVLAAALSYRIHKLRTLRRSSRLVARAWDLSKAYKNLALHPDSVSDAFLAVWNPDTKRTEVYGQLVLPFGARSSVHSFCRTSLGIWIIGVSVFMLHWGVYFDDFIGSEEPCLAKLFELCADGLFMLLGWATSSDKASKFDTIAQVLGLKINLAEASLGFIHFENTEHRREQLIITIDGIIEASFLSRKDGERLRGRLQFAEQQISGKRAGLAFKEVSKHVSNGGGRLGPGTLSALSFLKEHVASAPARCIADRSCFTWHLYVDASNDDSKSGIGGILIAETGAFIGHFSEYLDEPTLADLNTSGSENPIFELECFAIWCGVCTWASLFRHCHLIVFTDNDGALHSMINGRSENDSGGRIVSATHNFLDNHFIHPWFERVNTSSNLSDFPSRGISKPEWGSKVSLDFQRLARVARAGGDVPSSEPSEM